MSPTPAARGDSMGKNGLLRMMWCAVTSPMSFTDNSSVHCFNQVWLGKATYIVGARKGI